jgi:hypothetical protein
MSRTSGFKPPWRVMPISKRHSVTIDFARKITRARIRGENAGVTLISSLPPPLPLPIVRANHLFQNFSQKFHHVTPDT